MERIWMAVTADAYELPLCIADSAKELAEICGTTENNVYSCVSKGLSGRGNGRKFVRVEVEE